MATLCIDYTENVNSQSFKIGCNGLHDLSRLRGDQSPGQLLAGDLDHIVPEFKHPRLGTLQHHWWKGSPAKDNTHSWRENTEGNIADRQATMDLTSILSLETWVLLVISLVLLYRWVTTKVALPPCPRVGVVFRPVFWYWVQGQMWQGKQELEIWLSG